MKAKHVLSLIGGLLLLAGIVIGLVPVSSNGSSCGSVFSGANPYLVPASCGDMRSMLNIPVWLLALTGGALLVVAFFVHIMGTTPTQSELRQPTTEPGHQV